MHSRSGGERPQTYLAETRTTITSSVHEIGFGHPWMSLNRLSETIYTLLYRTATTSFNIQEFMYTLFGEAKHASRTLVLRKQLFVGTFLSSNTWPGGRGEIRMGGPHFTQYLYEGGPHNFFGAVMTVTRAQLQQWHWFALLR